MTVTLLDISDDTIGICQSEMEWDDIYLVKDKIINKQLKKYFNFIESQTHPLVYLNNKSDATVIIEGDSVFILKIEDDCPYLEEL